MIAEIRFPYNKNFVNFEIICKFFYKQRGLKSFLTKVVGVFLMVIRFKFRMRQYWDDDHRENAVLFRSVTKNFVNEKKDIVS